MSKAKINNMIAKYEGELNKLKLNKTLSPAQTARKNTINEVLSVLAQVK